MWVTFLRGWGPGGCSERVQLTGGGGWVTTLENSTLEVLCWLEKYGTAARHLLMPWCKFWRDTLVKRGEEEGKRDSYLSNIKK